MGNASGLGRVPIYSRPREAVVRAKIACTLYVILGFIGLGSLAPRVQANVTVLLEEPYSYDGDFAGTGHAAVYLTRVCAETPVHLKRCRPGERGVVISRYARISGYDWIAIPLIPYLYAVENPEDVPLFADPRLEAFLRDQYRRAHLENLAPDLPGGETPKGDWYELIGSSYDRTNYGFEIVTTPEQDDAFIAWINSRPNHGHYQFIRRNCADFVRQVLNFYYPKSESRGSIADLFVSTPKHAAKSLVRYSKHHPDLQFTHFVIPQVPGSVKRSGPVRGVLESVFRAKKYVIALAAINPFVAGGGATVYLVADRFNPARNAVVFSVTGSPQAAPTNDEKQAYLRELHAVETGNAGRADRFSEISWKKFVETSQPDLDADGQPVLQLHDGNGTVDLGVARDDLLSEDAPVELQRELMVVRLKQALAHNRAPRISGSELREDWQLLEKIDDQEVLSKKMDREEQPASE